MMTNLVECQTCGKCGDVIDDGSCICEACFESELEDDCGIQELEQEEYYF